VKGTTRMLLRRHCFAGARLTLWEPAFFRNCFLSCSSLSFHNLRVQEASTSSQKKRKKSARERKLIPVVLTADVEKLGAKGEEVKVAKGYARNFLFPKKLALYATEENLKLYEADRLKIDLAQREKDQQLAKAKKRLSNVVVEMKRHLVSMNPQTLHAGVSRENIAEKLWKQHKIRLRPEDIKIASPYTTLGTFTVPVTFASVEVPLKVTIAKR